jgi:fatty-acyl-CoA synthase
VDDQQAATALARSRNLVLGEIVARNARRVPGTVAVVFEGSSRTYAELNSRVNRLAGALEARGVGRGDKVALLMYNRLEVVESFLACHKLGAVAVPVNFRLVPRELDYLLRDSDAVGILTDTALLDLAIRASSDIDSVRFVLAAGVDDPQLSYERALAAAPDEEPAVIVEDSDLAFLMYTSGTTGRPKGAMLTHRNLVVNTLNWIVDLGVRADDVWLSGLPLFHIGGVNGVLPFLYLGSTCVITPSTGFDAAASLRLLAEHRVSVCYFVPTQWQQICALPEVADIDRSRLRLGLWGASQAPVELLERMAETFPEVGLVNAFGQTEMSSNTCFLKPADAQRKRGSVGVPVVNVEVRIVDGEDRDVPAGAVGELVYRGPTVMAGYYGNGDATAEAFRNGWLHSGDLGRQDEDGYIWVVDRKKDMIISGGENIYPAEVERALGEHPAVADVAVFGVPHPKWVETPVAVLVPAGEERPSQEELLRFVADRLASYKKPAAVVWVDELPRNASGKVLKRTLREEFAELFD